MRGDLHLPENGKKKGVVIGSHGLFATRQSPKQLALADACKARGLAFFRFDHRGCGQSEGGPDVQCSFEARRRDLLSAHEYLRGREENGCDFALFGSSLGGAVACRVSSIVRSAALVVFAAPTASRAIFDFLDVHNQSDSYPAFFYQNLSFDNGDLLANLSNILIFHGEMDEIVPVTEARRIYNAAGEPRKLVVQKKGDHRMSDEAHQRQFVRMAAEWFEKGFERKKTP